MIATCEVQQHGQAAVLPLVTPVADALAEIILTRQVGIVTGRRSMALVHRCRNLGLTLLRDGVRDKAAALEEILKETGVAAEATAFVGDDLPDLPIMRRVGVPIAVGDAHDLVKQEAVITTRARGGHGAVREISERILKARGDWKPLLHRLFP